MRLPTRALLFGILLCATARLDGNLTDSGGHVSEALTWNVFEVKADPILDRFYVTDSTNFRILAIDAQSGAVVATASVGNGPFFLGRIQFSVDGSRVYVANASEGRIYTFRTSDLTSIGSIDVSDQVINFVFGSDGYLYLVKGDPVAELHKIDPVTGLSVESLPYPAIRKEDQLMRSETGHRIFAVGSSGVYQSSIRFGKIPMRFQSFRRFHLEARTSYWDSANTFLSERGYDPDGVSSDPIKRSIPFVGVNPKGLSNQETSPYVFVSDDDTGVAFTPGVRSYRRSDGAPHRSWALPSSSGSRHLDGAIAVSQSGNLLYGMSHLGTGNSLRLVRIQEDPGSPPVVLQVQATEGVYPDKVVVSWETMAEVDGFEVLRAAPYEAPVVVGQSAENRWTDFDVAQGTEYKYWVRAVVAGVTGPYSMFRSDVGFAASEIPSAPWPSSRGGPHTIELFWNKSPDAASYDIYRSVTSSVNDAVFLVSTDETAWEDNEVEPGIFYYYWIRSVNPSGISGFRSSTYAQIVRGYLTRPLFVSASDGIFDGAVEIVWNGSEYTIYRHTENDSENASVLASSVSGGRYIDDTVLEGIRYFYWVQKTTSYGSSELSGADAGFGKTDLALDPEEIHASAGTFNDRIEITWSEAPNAEVYEVYRSVTDSFGDEILLGSVAGLSYSDMDVEALTSYTYRVKSRNAHGSSAFSIPDSGYRIEVKPDAPTNAWATAGAFNDKVRIFWDAAPRASTYSLYRSTQSVSSLATLVATGLTGTVYEDTAIVQQSVYYYWVKATNSSGTSDFSNRATGFSAPQPPPPPADVTATDGVYHDRVILSWSSVPVAATYRVFRSQSDDFSTATEVGRDLTALSWTDFFVQRLTPYFYWVVSVNVWGVGQPGPSAQGYSRAVQLGTPSNLMASQGAHLGKVSLTWSAAADASSYRIYRGTSSNGVLALIGNSSGNAFSDNNADPGRSYYYEVRAYYPGVELSAPSSVASGYAGIGIPSGIAASSGLFQARVKVTWNAVDGADGFEILRGLDADGSDATVIGSTMALEFFDDEGNPGIRYYYSVRAIAGEAVSGAGDSDEGHGTVGLPFRPDLLVGNKPNSLRGNDLYEGSGAQTVRQVSRRSRPLRFWVGIQNDGETADRLIVSLSKGNRFFTVSLLSASGVNQTGAAIRRTLEIPLASRRGTVSRLMVKPSRKANGRRMRQTLRVSGRSLGAPLLTDSVKAQAVVF